MIPSFLAVAARRWPFCSRARRRDPGGFDALHIHAPEMVYDLPAAGKRLIQKVDGYRYTICSGEVIYQDGTPTGALPGKLVRGPQRASA